jgi:hypothetical protein
MTFAYSFLNEQESFDFYSKEDMINFIIDHYFELMSIYRVMKKQNIETKKKQEDAHQALQSIRKKEETLNGEELTEAEKLQLKETKEYLSHLREENDIHHYNHEELEMNHLTMLIVNHPVLMIILERFDSILRNKIANISPIIIKPILMPIAWLTRKSIKYTPEENEKSLEILNKIDNIVSDAPDDIRDIILESMEVNLEDHLPKDDKNDNDQTYTF